jgi:ATP-dependent RNA circularization protein (DNA/RNA ligase family)
MKEDKNSYFRFPHTPHIQWLGVGEPRYDKLLSLQDLEELLSGAVVIEEKVDGANIGFSLNSRNKIQVQNRGAYMEPPFSGQFSRLNGWLGQFACRLESQLTDNLIAFGEWCAAKHTLWYNRLPDYFLLFDVYDKKEGKFWSVSRRNEWAQKLGVQTTPKYAEGYFSTADLQELLFNEKSFYRAGYPEGIIVRNDETLWNRKRGKLVRAEFVQSIETHWRSKQIEWNGLADL